MLLILFLKYTQRMIQHNELTRAGMLCHVTLIHKTEWKMETNRHTLVTLGWSSLCHTTTSCVKAALSEATSASVLWPSSPQSRSLTVHQERAEKGKQKYEMVVLHLRSKYA